ncbi:hypothetical protein Droror1_Dr00018524 [Drosera rotundifolia]
MMGLSWWMEISKQDNWGFDCGALRPVVLVKGSYARLQSCSKVRTSSGVLVWLRVEFGARSCSSVWESVRGRVGAAIEAKNAIAEGVVAWLQPFGVLRVSPSRGAVAVLKLLQGDSLDIFIDTLLLQQEMDAISTFSTRM